MGTVAAVQCADPAAAPQARDLARDVFTDIDREFSSWRPDSALAAVNLAAGSGQPIPVSPRFATVLGAALALCEESGGAFNPLVGPVMRAWGFNGAALRPARPSDAELAAATALADWRNIFPPSPNSSPSPIPSPSLSLALPRAGMSLDLGAIAKGYAVDLAWDRLKAAGHTNLLVDLGGNLRALGEAAPGRAGWRTGVRNPFIRDALIARFLLRDGEAVATSGNYERFVEIDGLRHAHIMDGRTGHPVTGMASVTVIAPDAAAADGLSTALFILGPREGAVLLRRHPGSEALWIPDSPNALTLLATPGFAARLTPADDTPYALTLTD
jgi:thiamine biosynthesis lipoprotein